MSEGDRLVEAEAYELSSRWAEPDAPRCEIGPGWRQLLGQLESELAALCPQYQLLRLRRRDGLLRYEIRLAGLPAIEPQKGETILAMRRILDRYEQASAHICEQSGQDGRLMGRGGEVRVLSERYLSSGWQPIDSIHQGGGAA